ncbi:hypothetical protein [Psychromonas aquimarina]|uniref:hypothetical protein n=1 Tax=Psychromonas aquimarina TaxID=444919 RepID=UPI00048FC8DF|nr:hypothetical protein [Psychromonas aquimarina]
MVLISSQTKKQKYARWTMLLVVMIMTFCLSQRAGFVTSCSINASQQAQQELPVLTLDECDSAVHLLQWFAASLDAALFTLLLTLLLVVCFSSYAVQFVPFTAPRAPPLRRHLVFCVFRE